ncbi:MAG: phosphate/phosphite/phosphonate ABC transporter substrate-binding protein [Desulfobulbaceae bacterium]|nr:phosphate/phosphite/phosphonate ABC transporter substrate-binding protein [Desulfobulbaceae bacterium]
MVNRYSHSAATLILAALLCLVVIGCRDQRTSTSEVTDSPASQTLKIGIVPEKSIFRQKERYAPFAEYLSQKTGLKVELLSLLSYENIIDSIQTRDLDAAFLGSFTGALVLVKLEAQPLVRPQHFDGSSTYHGLIFTRKDSGINTVQDMKGKRFALVDKATTAGWLLPLHYFKEHRIDDPSAWFAEIYFTGTHEDAILDVLDKRADIGAAKNTVFYGMAEKNPRIINELTILTASPPVPSNTLFICQDIEQKTKEILRETLLAMHRNEEGRKALHDLGAAKFIATAEQDFQPVFQYAEEIGLDFALYENESPSVNTPSDR